MSDENDGRVVEPTTSTHGVLRRSHPSWEAIARCRDRLLDGRHPWGTIETGPDRQGFRRYRLTVFPPGITMVERRLLRLWRAMPTWAAVLWLVTVICLNQAWGPWAGFAAATAIYAVLATVTATRLGPLRTRVRTLTVVTIAGHTDPEAAAAYGELRNLSTVMCTADILLGQGRISATEHEMIWWQVYERADDHDRQGRHDSRQPR